MKYIVFDSLRPVVFPELFTHAEIAESVDGVPTSAGFVDMGADQPVVHGRSISLGIDSKPGDSQLIKAFYKG